VAFDAGTSTLRELISDLGDLLVELRDWDNVFKRYSSSHLIG